MPIVPTYARIIRLVKEGKGMIALCTYESTAVTTDFIDISYSYENSVPV